MLEALWRDELDFGRVVRDTAKEDDRDNMIGLEGMPALEKLRQKTIHRLLVIALAVFVELVRLTADLDENEILGRGRAKNRLRTGCEVRGRHALAANVDVAHLSLDDTGKRNLRKPRREVSRMPSVPEEGLRRTS